MGVWNRYSYGSREPLDYLPITNSKQWKMEIKPMTESKKKETTEEEEEQSDIFALSDGPKFLITISLNVAVFEFCVKNGRKIEHRSFIFSLVREEEDNKLSSKFVSKLCTSRDIDNG